MEENVNDVMWMSGGEQGDAYKITIVAWGSTEIGGKAQMNFLSEYGGLTPQ